MVRREALVGVVAGVEDVIHIPSHQSPMCRWTTMRSTAPIWSVFWDAR
ncbi:MAG: hypothetical protein IPH23_12265 [Gammaproteobacteria bacterium]|nr:hypothetical protein [Gammaproteobacteria bacterium]